jgi:23S rRNA-intervening sequence protein
MDDSPPPFIVFRKKPTTAEDKRVDVYQLALDFTEKVVDLLLTTEARFFLKDRLDRNATGIALHVAQAVKDLAPSGRRKSYGVAYRLAVDCSTVLDILARRSDVNLVAVSEVQAIVSQLVSNLDPLRT